MIKKYYYFWDLLLIGFIVLFANGVSSFYPEFVGKDLGVVFALLFILSVLMDIANLLFKMLIENGNRFKRKNKKKVIEEYFNINVI